MPAPQPNSLSLLLSRALGWAFSLSPKCPRLVLEVQGAGAQSCGGREGASVRCTGLEAEEGGESGAQLG